MKRFVSYLYSVQNNQKIQNEGFARIELRTGRNRIEVHLKDAGYAGKTGTVYLFVRNEKNIQGIPIGNLTFRGNQADLRYEQPEEIIGQTSWTIMQMNGIIITIDEKVAFLSQWDEIPVDTEKFKIWEQPDGEKEREDLPRQQSGSHDTAETSQEVGSMGKNIRKNGYVSGNITGNAKEKTAPNRKLSQRNNGYIRLNGANQGQETSQASGDNRSHKNNQANGANQSQNTIPENENQQSGNIVQKDRVNQNQNITQENGIYQSRNIVLKNGANQSQNTVQADENNQANSSSLRRQNNQANTSSPRRQNNQANSSSLRGENNQANTSSPKGGNNQANTSSPKGENNQANTNSPKGENNQANIAEGNQEALGEQSEQSGQKREPSIRTAEIQPQFQPGSQKWEQTWRNMLRTFPVIRQFEEKDDVLCVRIEIKDVRLLPDKYWSIVNNSFLLHGFFNYRYLAFGRIGQNWFIGVPGIYQNQEHAMAAIFGFPDFLPQKQKNERGEQPGYWYRILEVN